MKRYALLLLPLLVLLFSVATFAQKPQSNPSPSPLATPSPSSTPLKLERETPFNGDVTFPEVDGWDLSDKYRYPTAALGYSVNYETASSRVTVYVYTGGRTSIPNDLGGVVADEMKKSKTELQAAVEAGLYESADAGKTESITIAKNKGLVKALYAPLKIKARGNSLTSEIFIFPYNNYFVKIRATHRDPQAAAGTDFAALREALDLLFSK